MGGGGGLRYQMIESLLETIIRDLIWWLTVANDNFAYQ